MTLEKKKPGATGNNSSGSSTNNGMISPPTYAKRLGVKPEKVLSWIRSGELRAIDISIKPGLGKPRYRISEADIIVFENRRSSRPATQLQRRSRQSGPDVIEYF